MNSRPEVSPETLTAALLADSVASQETALTGVNLAAVFELLRKNQVPLRNLVPESQRAGLSGDSGKFIRNLLAEDEAILQLQRSEYTLVIDGLKKRGIPTVLIKSVGKEPSFPYTSDNVDLMVPVSQIAAARAVLVELEYTEFPHIEEPLKFLFRKFSGGDSISAIHLHGQVGWGVPFLLDGELWKKVAVSADDPAVVVPDAEDALMITMAHAFYENKRIKLLDLVRIRHCLRRKSALDFEYIRETVIRRGWLDGFSFLVLLVSQLEEWLYGTSLFPEVVREQSRQVLNGNRFLSKWLKKELERERLDFPFRVSFVRGKIVYYKKILFDREDALRVRLWDFFRTLAWGVKLKLKIRGQRGFLVTLSGIDGSGKTVHANTLQKAFTTADILSSRHWSRFGSPGRKGSGSSGKSESTADSLLRRQKKLKYYWLRLAWLLVYLSKTCFEFGLLLRLKRFFGGVIICDRYIFDSVVEIKHSIPDQSLIDFAQKTLLFFCPRPNMAWLLDVPAETAAQRQPDENCTEASTSLLNAQRADYLQLASKCGIRILPTSSAPECSTTRMVRETLGRYFTGYRTFVNWLLISNPSQMNPK